MTGVRDEAVVCVHGLWLSGFATRFWRTQFERAGYAAHAFSYPSVRGRMAHNRTALARFVDSLPQHKVHFAGHSLGAVTIVSMLDSRGWQLTGKELGRIVLAGPPFQDSRAGRALVGGRNVRPVLGKVGGALAGHALKEWLASRRPGVPPGVDLGVIAGDSNLGLGRMLVPDLKRPHDGTVSVEETHVAGEREHLVLPVGHTGMLMSHQVTRPMLRFIQSGSFG
jgi:pimeloyl-ACP methyl ester carboxylesterase